MSTEKQLQNTLDYWKAMCAHQANLLEIKQTSRGNTVDEKVLKHRIDSLQAKCEILEGLNLAGKCAVCDQKDYIAIRKALPKAIRVVPTSLKQPDKTIDDLVKNCAAILAELGTDMYNFEIKCEGRCYVNGDVLATFYMLSI